MGGGAEGGGVGPAAGGAERRGGGDGDAAVAPMLEGGPRAGVVGLAVARALALSGREVLLIEAEDAIGTQTSFEKKKKKKREKLQVGGI